MSNLSIKDVPDAWAQALRQRAAGLKAPPATFYQQLATAAKAHLASLA